MSIVKHTFLFLTAGLISFFFLCSTSFALEGYKTIEVRADTISKIADQDKDTARTYAFGLTYQLLAMSNPNYTKLLGPNGPQIQKKLIAAFRKVWPAKVPITGTAKQKRDAAIKNWKLLRWRDTVDYLNTFKTPPTDPELKKIYDMASKTVVDGAKAIDALWIKVRDTSNEVQSRYPTWQKFTPANIGDFATRVTEFNKHLKDGWEIMKALADHFKDSRLLIFTLQIAYKDATGKSNDKRVADYLRRLDYISSGYAQYGLDIKNKFSPEINAMIDSLVKKGKTVISNPGKNKQMAANKLVDILADFKKIEAAEKILDYPIDMKKMESVRKTFLEKIAVFNEQARKERIRKAPVPKERYRGSAKAIVAKMVKQFVKRWSNSKCTQGAIIETASPKIVDKHVVHWSKKYDAVIVDHVHYQYLNIDFVTDMKKHNDELWIYPATIKRDKTAGGWGSWYLSGEGAGYAVLKQRAKKALKWKVRMPGGC